MIWHISHEITIVLDTVIMVGVVGLGVYLFKNIKFGKDEYYKNS